MHECDCVCEGGSQLHGHFAVNEHVLDPARASEHANDNKQRGSEHSTLVWGKSLIRLRGLPYPLYEDWSMCEWRLFILTCCQFQCQTEIGHKW